jgi:hypothetical protein
VQVVLCPNRHKSVEPRLEVSAPRPLCLMEGRYRPKGGGLVVLSRFEDAY